MIEEKNAWIKNEMSKYKEKYAGNTWWSKEEKRAFEKTHRKRLVEHYNFMEDEKRLINCNSHISRAELDFLKSIERDYYNLDRKYGIYKFESENGIYIGKSEKLKDRIKEHFKYIREEYTDTKYEDFNKTPFEVTILKYIKWENIQDDILKHLIEYIPNNPECVYYKQAVEKGIIPTKENIGWATSLLALSDEVMDNIIKPVMKNELRFFESYYIDKYSKEEENGGKKLYNICRFGDVENLHDYVCEAFEVLLPEKYCTRYKQVVRGNFILD